MIQTTFKTQNVFIDINGIYKFIHMLDNKHLFIKISRNYIQIII